MNPVINVMRMHFRDKSTWLFVPWMVLLFSFLVELVVGLFVSVSGGFYFGGVASVYICIFVIGIVVLNETFPFALGFSVRRTDYFLGTTAMMAVTSASTAALLTLLSLVESRLLAGWGMGLRFFQAPWLTEGSVLQNLVVHFVLLMHMYLFGFACASIHRRFGRWGMNLSALGLILLITALTHFAWWDEIGRWLASLSAFGLALWLVPVTAVYAGAAYLLLRRATV